MLKVIEHILAAIGGASVLAVILGVIFTVVMSKDCEDPDDGGGTP